MRKTVGLLGTGLVTFMQNQLWRGATKAAQEYDVRLIFYPTINLSSWPPFPSQPKVLFDLVDENCVDGLLVWYAGIAEGIGIQESKHFFDRYESLPLVTVGGKLERHPNLSIDNYQGVRASIEHLIQDHQRRYFATIRGPVGHPDADERFRAYWATLRDHELPVRNDCIAESLFELQTAAQTTETVITHWLHDLKLKIDAVVTGSDYMALAAIRAIEACGWRVPEDIAVVGFDDVDDCQANVPSITTVRQPFEDLGYQAAKMLLALMDGQDIPQQTLMPAQLIKRESCGCVGQSLLLDNTDSQERIPSEPGCLNGHHDSTAIAQELKISQAKAENLITAFVSDLSIQSPEQFPILFRQHLVNAMQSDFNATAWQNALMMLQKQALIRTNQPTNPFAEILLNQARAWIAEVSQRSYIRQRIRLEQQSENLRQISEALITSFDRQILIETLYEQLPKLGFPSFYLLLYENPAQPASLAHLILGYENGKRLKLPLDGWEYSTGQLISDTAPIQAVSLVVEPLYFQEEQLGILVLEMGPTEGAIYENLRAQISSALQGSRLLQKVQQHTAWLEHSVAERTAALTQTVKTLQLEIAERLRAEEALRLANFAVEHASDAIYWMDENARLVDVNEAACQMLGYSGEELIGMFLQDINPQFDAETFALSWKMMQKSNLPPYETTHLTKDGQEIPVEIMANYITFENKELNCAIVRNISHRKEAEQAIRQLNDQLEQRVIERTHQLAAANKELEAFGYSVSHDLRAPLRVIEGYTQVLFEDYQKDFPDGAQTYLDRIQYNARRMSDLIDDLLAFSRIGRNPLQLRMVDVNQLVREILHDFEADGFLAQVKVIVDSKLPSCKADRPMLRQVWVNLISNAIKYSGKRENPRLEIFHEALNDETIYCVKDNGVGFDMQHAGQLFGVFQRLHKIDEYEGTGIGLAMVQRIVKRHGGKVWAEAELDRGATFYFTLGTD